MNSPWIETFAIALYVALLALSAVLQTLAVRGRLRPAPPRCARCGQLTSAAEFERSGACPECGADLRGEDGVRYFARSLRVQLLIWGIVAIILALATPFAFRFAVRNARSSPTVAPTTPLSELLGHVRAGNVSNSVPLVELHRRVVGGEATADEIADAVEAMVAGYEAKTAETAWLSNEAQGILVAAQQAHPISMEQLARLGSSVFSPPALRLRSQVRAGAQLDPRLFGGQSFGVLHRRYDIVRVGADGVALPLERMGDDAPLERLDAARNRGTIRMALPPGKHALDTTFELQYFLTPTPTMPPLGAKPDATATVTVRGLVEVVPEDAPSFIPLESDPAIARDVRRACIARRIAIDPGPRPDVSTIHADVDVEIVPDWTLVFRVIVRIDGKEFDLATLRASTRTKSQPGLTTFAATPSEMATEATVIFRPDPRSVEGDPDIERIWGEEVVVEHVPIVRGKGAPMTPLVVALRCFTWLIGPAIAAALVTLGIAGRRYSTRPLCRSCSTRLPFRTVLQHEPCPTCGKESDVPASIVALVNRPRIGLIVLGLVVIGAAIGAHFLANEIELNTTARPPGAQLASAPLSSLVDSAARVRWTLDANIIELQARLRREQVTSAALRAEFARATATAAQAGQPYAPTAGLRAVASMAMADGKADQAFFDLVLDRCFAGPRGLDSTLTETPPRIEWAPLFTEPNDRLVRFVVLRRVLVDGNEVEFHHAGVDAPILDASDGAVRPVTLEPLEPGHHEVAIEVDEWLMDAFSAGRTRRRGTFLPTTDWPEPVYRREKSIAVPLDIPPK